MRSAYAVMMRALEGVEALLGFALFSLVVGISFIVVFSPLPQNDSLSALVSVSNVAAPASTAPVTPPPLTAAAEPASTAPVTPPPPPTTAAATEPASTAPVTPPPFTTAAATESAGAAPVTPPPFTTAAAEPDRNEVAALLARGRAALANGDVAGARVYLRRAAEHNDPQAALALGETYDPVVLKHLGVIKFNADVALAREWYRRAADLGSSVPDAAGQTTGRSAVSIDEPAGSKVAVGDPGRDHGAESPEGHQSTEQKTAAMSQDEICKRDAAQLADLRISQERDEVIRFERDLGCEKLRPQVIRLRESLDANR